LALEQRRTIKFDRSSQLHARGNPEEQLFWRFGVFIDDWFARDALAAALLFVSNSTDQDLSI
jgi:hypothetical protein